MNNDYANERIGTRVRNVYVCARDDACYITDDEKAKVKNKEIMKKLKGHHVIRTLETNICGF